MEGIPSREAGLRNGQLKPEGSSGYSQTILDLCYLGQFFFLYTLELSFSYCHEKRVLTSTVRVRLRWPGAPA